jgi:hypothetical protein
MITQSVSEESYNSVMLNNSEKKEELKNKTTFKEIKRSTNPEKVFHTVLLRLRKVFPPF